MLRKFNSIDNCGAGSEYLYLSAEDTRMSNNRTTRRGLRRKASGRTLLPRSFHKPQYVTEDLDTYKALIIGLREEALKELESMQTSGPANKQEQLASHQAELVGQLNAALERIKQREYGCCEQCGLLIDKMRLMAVPHTRRCFACNGDIKTGARHFLSN